MHFTGFVAPLINQLWWLVPLAMLGAILKAPWFKGFLGEIQVRLAARIFLPRRVYRPLHNVTLKVPDGTTQIDHIFVSRHGLFVVETKNLRGWIFGGQHQQSWMQKIYGKTWPFQNPLRQNYRHAMALQELLGIAPEHIHSVIVFVGDSEFKTSMPPNVTQQGQYVRYIKSFTTETFSEAQVDAMRAAIDAARLAPTRATHQAHVANLASKDISPRCPKCASAMLVRASKRVAGGNSEFWGCSRFPDCRATRRKSERAH